MDVPLSVLKKRQKYPRNWSLWLSHDRCDFKGLPSESLRWECSPRNHLTPSNSRPNLGRFPKGVMWVKQCHKSAMTGNGNHKTHRNGDDWGLWNCFTHITPIIPNSWMVDHGQSYVNLLLALKPAKRHPWFQWFRGTSKAIINHSYFGWIKISPIFWTRLPQNGISSRSKK